MENLLISETWIDSTNDVCLGKSGVYESCFISAGEAFRDYQKQYGACISKIYIDSANGESIAIGWVFQKRVKYDDCNETYLVETWVMLHERKPKTVINYFHKEI